MLLIRMGRKPSALLAGDGDALRVEYRERLRRKGTIGGLFVEVEGTGKFDRDHVDLRVSREAVRGAGGRSVFTDARGTRPWSGTLGQIEVEQSREHLRVARRQDVETIAAVDREIVLLQAKIRQVRERRVEVVRRAWRRGNSLTPAALRERAEAELKERRRRIAAA